MINEFRKGYNILFGDLGHRGIRALEFDRFQTLAINGNCDRSFCRFFTLCHPTVHPFCLVYLLQHQEVTKNKRRFASFFESFSGYASQRAMKPEFNRNSAAQHLCSRAERNPGINLYARRIASLEVSSGGLPYTLFHQNGPGPNAE